MHLLANDHLMASLKNVQIQYRTPLVVRAVASQIFQEIRTMSDRSWLLRPQAIRLAKECIDIVRAEQGYKLLLSDPEFMQLLHEFVDASQSPRLRDSYSRLVAMAGVGNVMKNLRSKDEREIAQGLRRG